MKGSRFILATALIAAGCTTVPPTAGPVTTAPSATQTPVAAIDCGPVTNPLTCSSAVSAATDVVTVAAWRIASIAIAQPGPEATCAPVQIRCIRPSIIVRLVDDQGLVLEEIPLIATTNGGWAHPNEIRSSAVTG